MDELDRLYHRLVHNIRAGFPELLTRPFEVSQLYLQVVPYRTNRRELGFDSNEEYELAVMQLLAGLRGYVVGDAEMQKAMRQELASPNPDLTAYRVHATSAITLAPDPVRALERRGLSASAAGPAGATNGSPGTLTPGEQVAMAARATEAMEATGEQPRQHPPTTTAAGNAAPRPPAAPPPPSRPAAPQASTSPPPPASPTASPLSAPAAPALAPMTAPRGAAPPATRAESCRYCAHSLPEGRRVTFCPACGHNLTVQHCPACATELEVGWRFCITCGRQVGAAPPG